MNIIKLTHRVKQKAEEFENYDGNVCRTLDEQFNFGDRGFLFTRLPNSKDERSYDCLCMNLWSPKYKLRVVQSKENPGCFLAIDCIPARFESYQTVLEHGLLLKGKWIFAENCSMELELDSVDYLYESKIYQEEKEEWTQFNEYWQEYDSYNSMLKKMAREKEEDSIVTCDYQIKENILCLDLLEKKDCYRPDTMISCRMEQEERFTLLGKITGMKEGGKQLTVEVSEEQTLLWLQKNKKKKLEICLDDRGTKVRLARQRTAITNLYYGNTANPRLREILEDVQYAGIEEEQSDFRENSFQEKQNEALKKILSAKDIAMIQGPPGTGKTTVICRLIREIVKQNKNVLVASATHVAVDNVLQRVGKEPGVYAVRIGKMEKIEDDCREYLFDTYVDRLRNQICSNLSKVNRECENILETEKQVKEKREYYTEVLPVLERAEKAKTDCAEAEGRVNETENRLKSLKHTGNVCKQAMDRISMPKDASKAKRLGEVLEHITIDRKLALSFLSEETEAGWPKTKEYCSMIEEIRKYGSQLQQLEEERGKGRRNLAQTESLLEEISNQEKNFRNGIQQKCQEIQNDGLYIPDEEAGSMTERRQRFVHTAENLEKLIELITLRKEYKSVRKQYEIFHANVEDVFEKIRKLEEQQQTQFQKLGNQDVWKLFLSQDNAEIGRLKEALNLFGRENLPLDMDVREACLFTYEKLEHRKQMVNTLEELEKKREENESALVRLQFQISSLEMEFENEKSYEKQINSYRKHLGNVNDESLSDLSRQIQNKKQELESIREKEKQYSELCREKKREKATIEKELNRYYTVLSRWKNADYSIPDITKLGKLLMQAEDILGNKFELLQEISEEEILDYLGLADKIKALKQRIEPERQKDEEERKKVETQRKQLGLLEKNSSDMLDEMNLDVSLSNCLPVEVYRKIIVKLSEIIKRFDDFHSDEKRKEALLNEKNRLQEELERNKQKIAPLNEKLCSLRSRLPEKIRENPERESYYNHKKAFYPLEQQLGKDFTLIWYLGYLDSFKAWEKYRAEYEQTEKEIHTLLKKQELEKRQYDHLKTEYENWEKNPFVVKALNEFKTSDIRKAAEGIEKWMQEHQNVEGLKNDLIATQEIRKEWEQGLSLQKEFLEELCIHMANVVCATCSGVVSNENRYFQNKKYDYVIIDEAAKCDTLDMLIPMTMGRKIVLVGDHKQLKPILDLEVLEQVRKELAQEFLQVREKTSLFQKCFEEIDPAFKTMLNVQYRMAPGIAEFISGQFYEGKLITPPEKKEAVDVLTMFGQSMVWFDSGTYDMEEKVGNSYGNRKEAKLTQKVLRYIDEKLTGDEKKQVGIIAPYRGQIQLLTELLQEEQYHHLEIECNTVDAFQGREKDYILMNYVRNNTQSEVGFTVENERMNVAISRSRELFVMIASTSFVEMNAGIMKSMYQLYCSMKEKDMIKNERFLLS